MNHTISHIVFYMASYLLKWVFAIFNELLKNKSNTIGDNMASHIYPTSYDLTHIKSNWSVPGVYLLEQLLQILTPKSQLIILSLWSKSQGLNYNSFFISKIFWTHQMNSNPMKSNIHFGFLMKNAK
jgi:hypothetical protein